MWSQSIEQFNPYLATVEIIEKEQQAQSTEKPSK